MYVVWLLLAVGQQESKSLIGSHIHFSPRIDNPLLGYRTVHGTDDDSRSIIHGPVHHSQHIRRLSGGGAKANMAVLGSVDYIPLVSLVRRGDLLEIGVPLVVA